MKNEVYLIDCMEFMKGVQDKYYELAIIDPPLKLCEVWELKALHYQTIKMIIK